MTREDTKLNIAETLDISGGQAGDLDRLWAALGPFAAIADWHPAIAVCTIEEEGGATVRVLDLVGGGQIKERLESRDDDARAYTYTIIESPLPIANYRATISVTAAADGARLSWAGTFSADGVSDDEAKEIIAGIYAAGLQGMADMAGAAPV